SGTVTLTSGVLTGTGELTLADGASIVRAAGSLYGGTPIFSGTVNVAYTAGGVTTGLELPTDMGNVLQTLSFSPSVTVTLGADATANSTVTLASGATLASGGYTLTAKANVANAGTCTGTGKVLLSGSSAQALSGAGSYRNLELNNSAGATLGAATAVSGTLYLTAGALANGAGSLTLADGATISRASGTLGSRPTISSGAINVSYTGTADATAGNELPTEDTALNNLTLSYTAKTLTLDAAHTVNGTLTIGVNSTLADGTLVNGGKILTVKGNVYNDGTHSSFTGGKISLNALASQVLFGNGTYGNLELVQGEGDLAGSPTISGVLTLPSSGYFVVGANTLTLNGSLSGGNANNLVTTLASSLTIGASAPALTVPGSVALLNTLTLNNSAGVTLSAGVGIGGTLALGGSVLHSGSYVVSVQNPSLGCITRTTGWVDGPLQKTFVNGATGTFGFYVGDATACRPTIYSGMKVNGDGAMRVTLVSGLHPQIASSGLNTSKTLPFYWSRMLIGNTSVGSFNNEHQWTAADMAALTGADGTRFVGRSFSFTTGIWANRSLTDLTSTHNIVTSASNTSTPSANNIAEFVTGEPLASRLLVTLPGQTFTSGSGNAGTVSAQAAGTPFNLTLSAVDLFNVVDTTYSDSPQTITYVGPSGTGANAPAYTSPVTFTSGQAASIPTTLKTAETTTITATATTPNALTGVASSSLTVGSGSVAAGISTVAASPASVAADGATTSTLTVTLKDAAGNPVSGKTVTLASSRNTGGATPDAISAASGSSSAGGVVTFTASSAVAGSAAFTATGDGTAITQTATVIFFGALDHFAISSISSATAGTPITGVTLTAQDANNNTVTSFDGDGTAATYSGTAGITGTSGNFSAGVLSGVSVTPTKAGSSLTFVVTGGSPGKTGTVTITTINPGALDHFAVSSISSPRTAGTAITGVTLAAQDANNNTVTGFDGAGNYVTYSGTAGITGTSGNFSAGVLSGVSVTPTKAGSSLTLIVTGGSPGKTGMATITTINPGAIDHYAVSAVSPQAARSVFNTDVAAKDSNNNTVTTDSSTVVTMTGTGSVQFDSHGDGTFGDNTKQLASGAFSISTRDNVGESITITATSSGPKTGSTLITITPVEGDYQSHQTGDWSSVNTWERWSGSAWDTPASSAPIYSDGAIAILSGHTVTAAAGVEVDQLVVNSGGTLSVSTEVTVNLHDGEGTDLDVFGTLKLKGTGKLGGDGKFVIEPDGTLDTAQVTTLVVANGGNSAIESPITGTGKGLDKTTGAGRLTLSAENTYSGDTTIGAGTLALTGSGSIHHSPHIVIASGATLDVAGVTGASYSLAAGQTLKGNGDVHGAMTVASGATLSPGQSIGTLTFDNDLTLSGETIMEINKTGATLTSDKTVLTSGTLTYGGTLTVTVFGPSDALSGGETFDLFDAPAFSGSFSTYSLPTLPTVSPALNWYTGKLALGGDGTIYVNRAPVGGSHSITTRTNLPLAISSNKLKAGDTDADSDTLTVTGVGSSPTPSGATVSLSGTTITYTAPGNGGTSGSFEYTLDDGHGGTATVTVDVTILNGTAGSVSPNVVYGPFNDQGQFVVRFAGVPGRSYTVERSAGSTGPWVKAVNKTAPTDTGAGFGIGVFEYREAVAGSGYFRTVYPSYGE
ncbi:MAG: invasin domain 3-containing protein, partial [Verrucomicrobiota bacterium]